MCIRDSGSAVQCKAGGPRRCPHPGPAPAPDCSEPRRPTVLMHRERAVGVFMLIGGHAAGYGQHGAGSIVLDMGLAEPSEQVLVLGTGHSS
eukprot:5586924-Prorocentrum_lima.AAC.1